MSKLIAACTMAAALLLVACATPTPIASPTALPSSAVSSAAQPKANPPAAAPVPTAASAAPAAAAPAAASGDKKYAALPPVQRANVEKAPPANVIDRSKKYIATIVTPKGNIVVELDSAAAPITVNNFVYLARNGFYDGLAFHRVEPGFVIQGGDPAGNGSGGPGYTVPAEINLLHIDGAIAMARLPDNVNPQRASSGSQFYITMGPQSFLDGGYTVFGKTLSGLDVVGKVTRGDAITSITVVEGGAAGPALPAAPVAAVPTLVPVPTRGPATCEATIDPFLITTPGLEVLADDHITGNKDAASTLIEYSDAQCPACASFHLVAKKLLGDLGGNLRIVNRHFPLTTIHDKAYTASLALEAAALQGKFDALQDVLFTKQKDWEKTPPADAIKTMVGLAKDAGLDVAKLEKDMADPKIAARVLRDQKSAETLKLSGTPSLFLDGQPINAAQFADADVVAKSLKPYIDRRGSYKTYLAGKPFSAKAPDAVTEAAAKYELTLTLPKGDVQIELDPKLAPVNVNAVVFLAQKGWFKGNSVLINDAQFNAVLLSDPSGTGLGTPGFECGMENANAPATAWNESGTVALLSKDENTSLSQLVITYGPAPTFAGRFTVIGKVTAGLDNIKGLKAAEGATKADVIGAVSVKKK